MAAWPASHLPGEPGVIALAKRLDHHFVPEAHYRHQGSRCQRVVTHQSHIWFKQKSTPFYSDPLAPVKYKYFTNRQKSESVGTRKLSAIGQISARSGFRSLTQTSTFS